LKKREYLCKKKSTVLLKEVDKLEVEKSIKERKKIIKETLEECISGIEIEIDPGKQGDKDINNFFEKLSSMHIIEEKPEEERNRKYKEKTTKKRIKKKEKNEVLESVNRMLEKMDKISDLRDYIGGILEEKGYPTLELSLFQIEPGMIKFFEMKKEVLKIKLSISEYILFIFPKNTKIKEKENLIFIKLPSQVGIIFEKSQGPISFFK